MRDRIGSGSNRYCWVSRCTNSLISLAGLNAPLCLSFPIRMLNRYSKDTPPCYPLLSLILVSWVKQCWWQNDGVNIFFLSSVPLSAVWQEAVATNTKQDPLRMMWGENEQSISFLSVWIKLNEIISFHSIIWWLEKRQFGSKLSLSLLTSNTLAEWSTYRIDTQVIESHSMHHQIQMCLQ